MTSLEQRRSKQSLIVFFQSFRMHGLNYISNFFKPRRYNLRGSGLNVSQPSYNNRSVMHNSFSYFIAHVWNTEIAFVYEISPHGPALY